MTNEQISDPSQAWLSPLQADFLEHFFATQTGSHFFLTGGTALAAFYLHHRLSVDLDLFTLDDLALQEADILIPQIAADLECHIGRVLAPGSQPSPAPRHDPSPIEIRARRNPHRSGQPITRSDKPVRLTSDKVVLLTRLRDK